MALVLSTLMISKNSHIVLVVLGTLYAVHFVIRKISAGAPASHWTYPLAHPAAPSVHPGFFERFVLVLRMMPALLVAACAVLLVFF